MLQRSRSFLVVAIVTGVVTVGFAPRMSARLERTLPGAEQRVTLTVEGMTCGGCAAAVKLAAEKVDGVKSAKVSYEKGTAEITYDPGKTNPEAIAKAITEHSGFKASAPRADGRR